jgi:hypothetical protein
MSKKKRKQPFQEGGVQTDTNNKRQKTGHTSSSRNMHDFTDLKAWIACQEEYQVKTAQPAQLTGRQLKALAVLKLPPKPHNELGNDDTDWVGLLHRECRRYVLSMTLYIP